MLYLHFILLASFFGLPSLATSSAYSNSVVTVTVAGCGVATTSTSSHATTSTSSHTTAATTAASATGVCSCSSNATAGPFETRILEVATAFEENNGFWQLIDADGDGIKDLAWIKTANTGTGKVEVHIATGKSQFATTLIETGTVLDQINGTLGSFQMVKGSSNSSHLPDLVFIKTVNTGTNSVEVHIVTGASKYTEFLQEVGTTFALSGVGTYQMLDFDGDGKLDLCFIETSGTQTETVELHIASGASTYKSRILETGTTFTLDNSGIYSLVYGATSTPDLAFIKTANTDHKFVEVHVASGSSTYKTIIQDVTSTFAEDATDGPYSLVDFNRDGKSDLVFFKDSNTSSNKTEVHIASGAS
ncbi:hypothetical protein B7494_g4103 [Chlorociboria aeruginascens]|nr:hypothetical protein B7494_g4103 [Chlorociboria aeruginascens]